MMIKSKFFIQVLWVCLAPALYGQANLRPSKQYVAGEALYAAGIGAKSVVPPGWSGVLPRDSEIFLLLPEDGANGEIYVAGDDRLSEEDLKESLRKGLPLGNGNTLKSEGKIFKRGASLATMLMLTEKTSDAKGYLEVRCGPYGKCLTAVLLGSPQGFERMQTALYHFMDSLTWVVPNREADYSDFNWHEFLAGKHLLNYDYVPHAKAENDIWLCPDGTFTTKLKRSGLLKDQAKQYKGTQKGTWQTTSAGATGILTLTYEKRPPLEVKLEIKDDRIYLNGKRHFAMAATVCK